MEERMKRLKDWADKVRNVRLMFDMVHLLNEITECRISEKNMDEKDAIKWTLAFFAGVCVGEESKTDENFSPCWSVIWHDNIVDNFLEERGYKPLYH